MRSSATWIDRGRRTPSSTKCWSLRATRSRSRSAPSSRDRGGLARLPRGARRGHRADSGRESRGRGQTRSAGRRHVLPSGALRSALAQRALRRARAPGPARDHADVRRSRRS
jgi:hypothetical protein